MLKPLRGQYEGSLREAAGLLSTVKDEDKGEAVSVARELRNELGIELFATKGTYDYLKKAGVEVKKVNRGGSPSEPGGYDSVRYR